MYYKYWADNIPIFTLSTIFTVLVDSQCVFSWVCSADTQESKDCCLIPLFILHIAHTNTKCYITAVTQLYFDYAIFLYCIISLVDWMDGWWMVEWGIEGSPFVFQRYRNTKVQCAQPIQRMKMDSTLCMQRVISQVIWYKQKLTVALLNVPIYLLFYILLFYYFLIFIP